jgi:hypothetical protein
MNQSNTEQSDSYRAIHERAPVNRFPWVCSQPDCDEARPPNEPQDLCPRCGAVMIRGGRFLDLVARECRS